MGEELKKLILLGNGWDIPIKWIPKGLMPGVTDSS